MAVRFEQVTPPVRQHDCAVLGVDGRGSDQTLAFQVPHGLASIVAPVVEIALGDNAEGADGGKHPSFRAADLVYPVAISDRSALTPTRQVDILHEHVAQVVRPVLTVFAAAAASPLISITKVITIAVAARPRIVSVPHGCSWDRKTRRRVQATWLLGVWEAFSVAAIGRETAAGCFSPSWSGWTQREPPEGCGEGQPQRRGCPDY